MRKQEILQKGLTFQIYSFPCNLANESNESNELQNFSIGKLEDPELTLVLHWEKNFKVNSRFFLVCNFKKKFIHEVKKNKKMDRLRQDISEQKFFECEISISIFRNNDHNFVISKFLYTTYFEYLGEIKRIYKISTCFRLSG